jgi:hypothetical protein
LDDENPDQIDQTWSRNLKKPQVAYFREQIGATFQLNEEKKEIDYLFVVVQTSSRQFIKNWTNVTKFVMPWLSSWWILGSIIHMKVL